MTVDVEGLWALLAKATPGVWSWEDGPPTVYAGRAGDHGVFPGTNIRVRLHGFNLFGRLTDMDANGANNLNLIVAAVNALPKLLDALTAAREGWRMAPVEPTPEMLSHGDRAFEHAYGRSRMERGERLGPVGSQNIAAAWSAMLAAAPLPPPPSDAEVGHE